MIPDELSDPVAASVSDFRNGHLFYCSSRKRSSTSSFSGTATGLPQRSGSRNAGSARQTSAGAALLIPNPTSSPRRLGGLIAAVCTDEGGRHGRGGLVESGTSDTADVTLERAHTMNPTVGLGTRIPISMTILSAQPAQRPSFSGSDRTAGVFWRKCSGYARSSPF